MRSGSPVAALHGRAVLGLNGGSRRERALGDILRDIKGRDGLDVRVHLLGECDVVHHVTVVVVGVLLHQQVHVRLPELEAALGLHAGLELLPCDVAHKAGAVLVAAGIVKCGLDEDPLCARLLPQLHQDLLHPLLLPGLQDLGALLVARFVQQVLRLLGHLLGGRPLQLRHGERQVHVRAERFVVHLVHGRKALRDHVVVCHGLKHPLLHLAVDARHVERAKELRARDRALAQRVEVAEKVLHANAVQVDDARHQLQRRLVFGRASATSKDGGVHGGPSDGRLAAVTTGTGESPSRPRRVESGLRSPVTRSSSGWRRSPPRELATATR
mmetsp:Transcript_17297/g.44918  ORF Transcript_17297/g.44918 Transcript_17297/m.44918 type:complete len:328 (+) Transcript_17297:142-1125(+)